MECYKLKLADFESNEEAFRCADNFVAKQRGNWDEAMFEDYPDQLCEGCPAADLFWFQNYKGMGTNCTFLL